MSDEWETIHAKPSAGVQTPGRFDTVLVNTGNGKYTGLYGKYILDIHQ